MPIYMDRHDVSDAVTAEIVAHIHQEDLKIQDQFGCRGLTYWFDEKRKTAFCLIEAPDKNAIIKMHDHAHGEIPHQVIEVDKTIVESFLGRIEDPEKAQNTSLNIINDPAFRTIMVISFTQNSFKNHSIKLFTKELQSYKKQVFENVKLYNGYVVLQKENELLVSFKLVSKAVLCAFKIKKNFDDFQMQNQVGKTDLKVCLNCGTPVTEKKSIFEDTIRLADRMKYVSKREIIVSSEVRDLYMSENQNNFFDNGKIFALTLPDEDFIDRLLEFTDKQWQNPKLQVEDFQINLGLSKSKLYRQMIYLTQKSPNKFLNDYRLQRSLKLLRNQKNNISEVAFESGFNSSSYFAKCFRKRFGIMPSDFK